MVHFWFSKLYFGEKKTTLFKVIVSICSVVSSKIASRVVEVKPLAFRVASCHKCNSICNSTRAVPVLRTVEVDLVPRALNLLTGQSLV